MKTTEDEPVIRIDRPLCRTALLGFVLSILLAFFILYLAYQADVPNFRKVITPLLALSAIAFIFSTIGLVILKNKSLHGKGFAIGGCVLSIGIILTTVFGSTLTSHYMLSNVVYAQQTLDKIVSAQNEYKYKYRKFAPNISVLVKLDFLKAYPLIVCGKPGINSEGYSGYVYQMTAGKDWTPQAYFVRCRPESLTSGEPSFSVDKDGTIIIINRYE